MREIKVFEIKRIIVIIDNTVLEKLEKLSMLKIEENKKEELASQLTEILAYVENLAELNTEELSPTFSTLSGGTPLREDCANTNIEISTSIFSHAPNAENGFFIVPKIIE
jgi:aspartyl-tRNA(Asn)/glutamyl-tRNA(Gln) amidotransferase subunit C